MSVDIRVLDPRAPWCHCARFYEADKSFGQRDDYYGSMLLMFCGDEAEAVLATMRKEVTRADLRGLCTKLWGMGIHVLYMERERGRVVPFAEKVWESDNFSGWILVLSDLPFLKGKT